MSSLTAELSCCRPTLLITTRHISGLATKIFTQGQSLCLLSPSLLGSRWRHLSHNLHFFSSLLSVSWPYWQLKCSRSESVTLGVKKAGLHPPLLGYSNQIGPCPRLYNNWKENIHLIWQQQKTAADWKDLKLILTKAGGELWHFWIDLEFFYSTARVN